LANDGLVRPLDKEGDQWEVAHDFVARLLQPIVRNWRKSAWDSARPWLAPAALSVWLLAAVVTIFAFPSFHDDSILRDLRSVGLVPGAPNDQGSATFLQNGQAIEDPPKFWRVASRIADLGYPVAGLDLSATGLTTLQGMPPLPALTDLNLSATGLTTLQGMPPLPALANLELSYATHLNSLQGMPPLPALTKLDLSATGLTTLQGMPPLPALTDLNLSAPGLTTLQGMPPLPALTKLDLSATGLTTLQGIPALPELKVIDLNHIKELKSEDFDQLKYSPKLEKIIVTRGQIDPSAVPEDRRRLLSLTRD
jgi:hypothetical protein